MKRFALALAPVIAAAGLAGAAAADPYAKAVTFNSLDLLTERGVAAIERDIRRAAHEVCPIDNSRDLALRQMQRACVAQAIEAAEAQLQQRVVAAREDNENAIRMALVVEAGSDDVR